MFKPNPALAELALALFRIVLALLFLGHGVQKLFGFPAPSEFGVAAPLSFMGVAGLIELLAGLLVAVGLFTRPAAFIASGQMAIAYFFAHAGRGFFPILNGGELAIVFCFGFLLFSATGPGGPSLDRLRASRNRDDQVTT